MAEQNSKKSFLLCAVFFLCVCGFGQEKTLAVCAGQTGGCGFGEKSAPFVSWRCSYSASFWSVTGGNRFASGICDSTLSADFYKIFAPGMFRIKIAGGALYHAALLQDLTGGGGYRLPTG